MDEREIVARLARLEALLVEALGEARANRHGDRPMQMLVEPGGGRAFGVKSLRAFLDGALEVDIADPYIFAGGANEMATLENILPLEMRELRIFASKRDESSVSTLQAKLGARPKIPNFRICWTDRIHDRVWIARRENSTRACSVGTSLNGLGKKHSFILRLSQFDVRAFDEVLDSLTAEFPYEAIL